MMKFFHLENIEWWANLLTAGYTVVCGLLFLITWPVRRLIGFWVWMSLLLLVMGIVIRLSGFAMASGFEFVIRHEERTAGLIWDFLSTGSDLAINTGLGGLVFSLLLKTFRRPAEEQRPFSSDKV
jgi:hypothetical protein